MAISFSGGQDSLEGAGIYEQKLRKVKAYDVATGAFQALQLLRKGGDAGEVELPGQPNVRNSVVFLAADCECKL